MDAAEKDVLGLILGSGQLGELEAVAGEVCVLDHFVALVVVAKNHEAPAKRCPGARDALIEFRGLHRKVLAGYVLLPGYEGRLVCQRSRRKGIGGTGVRIGVQVQQVASLDRFRHRRQCCHGSDSPLSVTMTLSASSTVTNCRVGVNQTLSRPET